MYRCLKDLRKLCPLNKIILAVASVSYRALLCYQSEYSFLEQLRHNHGVAETKVNILYLAFFV